MDYGYNATSPSFSCCGDGANASLCTAPWSTRCANMCAATDGTSQYMGGLHPRSKRCVAATPGGRRVLGTRDALLCAYSRWSSFC